MHTFNLHLLLAAALHCTAAEAQAKDPVAPPSKRQLINITEPEAEGLIERLKQAQSRLTKDKSQTFELLSGSRAFLPQTKVSPEEAFLSLPFEKVWNIERSQTDNRFWQPYRLAYAPNGLGQLYWEIEVVLGFHGEIERITMLYKPPAPF